MVTLARGVLPLQLPSSGAVETVGGANPRASAVSSISRGATIKKKPCGLERSGSGAQLPAGLGFSALGTTKQYIPTHGYGHYDVLDWAINKEKKAWA